MRNFFQQKYRGVQGRYAKARQNAKTVPAQKGEKHKKKRGTDMGEMVAKQSGVKVVYLDTLTRGDYSADSYLEGMKSNIEQLKEAFQ